jgi:uncharacterized iron-regulated membrane protein
LGGVLLLNGTDGSETSSISVSSGTTTGTATPTAPASQSLTATASARGDAGSGSNSTTMMTLTRASPTGAPDTSTTSAAADGLGRGKGGRSEGQLAGIYFGVAAVVMLAIGAAIWWRRRRILQGKGKSGAVQEPNETKRRIRILRKGRESEMDGLPWQELPER